MLIAAKVLGATCLAGALAASGVITTEHLSTHPEGTSSTATAAAQPPAVGADADVTTDTEPSTTTTTEAPTTTTTQAPPTIVTLPPPVQPTVIPVAGAGTVVIVLQGPIVVVREVKVVPGWVASVERRAGAVDVLFRRGDRTFRFFASMIDRRLSSAIREVRPDGDHPVTFDDQGDHRDGDRRWDRH